MHKSVVWLDGTIIPAEQATIPITTHTLHYGSGAFEGIRCYETAHGPAIFRLSEHIDRLMQSFACFHTTSPWSKQMIEQGIIDLIQTTGLQNCYLRPLLFFGSESLLISPKKLSVHCAIIAFDMEKYLGREAISVGISFIKRIHRDSLPVAQKINGFYVNSIFALHEVQERGFDEALLLDHENAIAEGSVANIFFVIDNSLVTPTAESILPGITRTSIIEIAESAGMRTQQKKVMLADIEQATEAFFTGTASEITAIKNIEHKQFKVPSIIASRLNEAYHDIVYGRDSRFYSWLTFIHQ